MVMKSKLYLVLTLLFLVILSAHQCNARLLKETKDDQIPPTATNTMEVPVTKMKLDSRFGPMVLNILSKGRVPPSGPSRGTNELNS
ncbi:hypothetical protein FCM35_KLT03754 [Carex littledalei]|uniref:Transmembrane protein n=1 Tax=Carex littledalei TaxID=544730 RepID=A0A833QPX5_9POAL|nr:hypothetical protein FCM35_KLT03754 [Carex littledalei]